MQGYQEKHVYSLTNHYKNTVAYIQIPKSSISQPLFYQSRSTQGVITKNYLNFVTILSNIAQSQKSNFLSSIISSIIDCSKPLTILTKVWFVIILLKHHSHIKRNQVVYVSSLNATEVSLNIS